jgi:hypothetical protein
MLMTLEEVRDSKQWNPFGVEDPFNPNNFVEGYICVSSTDKYGALFIHKVNGYACSQYILVTPKLHYPFDQNDRWHFPNAVALKRYTKLDGTNITAFAYNDSQGNRFVSYKTRLRPFVQQSTYGPFIDMWQDMLKKYPRIPQCVLNEQEVLAFELWGSRNPHLVKYLDPPLEASLLFVRHNGRIKPYDDTKHPAYGLSVAPYLGDIDRDYVWSYQQAQEELGQNFKAQKDGTYLGEEGEVWYLLDERGDWYLYKCKCAELEAIHWSAGGINKNAIIATCWNALENWDIPSVENIETLLLEEFQKQDVDRMHYHIEKCLSSVISQCQYKQHVLGEYAALGMSVLDSKADVMRALSGKFPKGEIQLVYAIIEEHVLK